MARYRYYNKIGEENEVEFFDLDSIDWSAFIFNKFTTHYISASEIDKTYLISQRYYDIVEMEDILLLINNILNPFDLFVGQLIKIPPLQDITDFILQQSQL